MNANNEKLLGVVLAGGKATRLANKALLPIRGHKILIESSIDYLLRVMPVNDIVISERKDFSIQSIIKDRYPRLSFMYHQDSFSGILAVLIDVAKEAKLRGYTKIVVVCCDNIYPEEILHPCALNKNTSSVIIRQVSSLNALRHLDQYNSRCEWLRKQDPRANKKDNYAITTPWIIDVKHLEGLQADLYTDIVELFSVLRFNTLIMPLENWADLGTEETYKEYWR